MSWLNDAEVTTKADKDRQFKDSLISSINNQRKEQETLGVTINGIRYAGNESNRNALAEAQDMAADAQISSFPKWKDSDGRYHDNHPVSDVIDARRAIGQRRMALIGKEGQYKDQIESGTLTDVSNLDWTV